VSQYACRQRPGIAAGGVLVFRQPVTVAKLKIIVEVLYLS